MITKKLWIRNIYRDTEPFADKYLQERLWVRQDYQHEGEKWMFFDELAEIFLEEVEILLSNVSEYDKAIDDDEVNYPKVSDSLRNELQILYDQILAYPSEKAYEPESMLKDPVWHEVQTQSAKCLKLLKENFPLWLTDL